ncbi:hypothetical protein X975_02463, partial [Stegodyphus mimosarum]
MHSNSFYYMRSPIQNRLKNFIFNGKIPHISFSSTHYKIFFL